jgi:HlyD family secretion protein
MSLIRKKNSPESEESSPSSHLADINKLTYATLVLAVSVGLFWLFTAEISSAVIINGSIKVYKNRVVLQHPEGGKIAHVHVTEGQEVKEGQLILDLDNAQIESNLRNLLRQSFSEQVRADRLKAEINYPDTYLPTQKPEDQEQAEIIRTERNLYESRKRNLNSQVSALNEQIAFIKDEISALNRTVANDETISQKNQDLATKGFVSAVGVMNTDQALNQHRADLARAKQRIAEMQQKIPVIINDFKNNAATEYRTVNERLLDIGEKQRPTDQTVKNLRVVSNANGRIVNERLLDIGEKQRPTDQTVKNLRVVSNANGRIVNLTKLGQGSVLGAKETIAEIVPGNRTLILEGSLPTEQVIFVKEGMPTRVSISQLKQLGEKDLTGRVKTISADSVSQGAMGTLAYVVQVEITDIKARNEALLRPGMPAEIFIQTGTRSPFEYLTHPISAYMNRAGKEPN